jgi:hypothetical protein
VVNHVHGQLSAYCPQPTAYCPPRTPKPEPRIFVPWMHAGILPCCLRKLDGLGFGKLGDLRAHVTSPYSNTWLLYQPILEKSREIYLC